MRTNYIYIAALTLLTGASCGDSASKQDKGPIVLGDTATIVTERDSQYLKDDIIDIGPRRPAAVDTSVKAPASRETTVVPSRDTPATAKRQPEAAGQSIDFGTAKVVLTGLKLKESRKQNPSRESGLSYSLSSGNLGSAKLVISGAKNVSIKQRYQSRLLLKSDMGTVDLRDLGLYTSGWNTIPASGQSFALSGLNRIAYSQVNNNKIKNAADRELRKRRTNNRTIQSWMQEIKSVRSAGDKPCEIILDNVQWQISGTDEKGKAFHKTIRVDA